MPQRAHSIKGIFAIIACLALLASPARADDPRLVVSSPVLLPGANQAVCDQLQNSAAFGQQMTLVARTNMLQQPTSLSSCIQGLITKVRTFANVFSAGFSLDAAISVGYDAVLDQIVTSLENEVCSKASGLLDSVETGIIGHTSISNIMGGYVKGSITLTPNSDGTPLTGDQIASQEAAADATQSDDLDTAAITFGSSLKPPISTSTGTLPPPDLFAQDNATTNNPPPTYPMNSATAPNNATICMAPDMRNDLARDTATLDGDSPLLNPANYNDTSTYNSQGESKMLEALGGPNAPASGNPVVPQTNTPNPGDKPSGNTAPIPAAPAAANGSQGCSSNSSTTGHVTSGGTNCTANTKLGLTCGSTPNCNKNINNGIGFPKDFMVPAIIAHGPYGSGTNLGQCAQLPQYLVPNLGNTKSWRRGPPVYPNGQCDQTIPAGTPIATFFGPAQNSGAVLYGQVQAMHAYNYEPNNPAVHEQHTGLFLHCESDGSMSFLEEYHGLPAPHTRPMEKGQLWNGDGSLLLKNKNYEMHAAQNYYVIVH